MACRKCDWFGIELDLIQHSLTHEKGILRCEHAPHCDFVCKRNSVLEKHEKVRHEPCPIKDCEYRGLAAALNTHVGVGRHTGSAEVNVTMPAVDAAGSKRPDEPSAAAAPAKRRGPKAAIEPVRIQGIEQNHDRSKIYAVVAQENLALFKRALRTTLKYGDLACLPNHLLTEILTNPYGSGSSNWLAKFSSSLPLHAAYTPALPNGAASVMSPFYIYVTPDKSAAAPALKGQIEDYDAHVQQWQDVMGITAAQMTDLLSYDVSTPLYVQKMIALKFAEWNRDHARFWTPFLAFLATSRQFAPTTAPKKQLVLAPVTLAEARRFDLQGQGKVIARQALEDTLAAAGLSPAAFLILTCAPGFTVAPCPSADTEVPNAAARCLANREGPPLVPLVWEIMSFRLLGTGKSKEPHSAFGHSSFPTDTGVHGGLWADYLRTIYGTRDPSAAMEEELLRAIQGQARRPLRELRENFLTQEELVQVFIEMFTDGPNLKTAAIAILPSTRHTFTERCRNAIQVAAGKAMWRVEDWTESDLRKLDIFYQVQGSFNGVLDYLGLWEGHTRDSLRRVITSGTGRRWDNQDRSPARLKELLRQEGITDPADVAEFLSLITPARVPRPGIELA